MPYYIYQVSEAPSKPSKQLQWRHTFDAFKEAKVMVRSLRAEQDPRDSTTLKIIFAETQAEAEQRLSEVREKPILKEWEK